MSLMFSDFMTFVWSFGMLSSSCFVCCDSSMLLFLGERFQFIVLVAAFVVVAFFVASMLYFGRWTCLVFVC